MVTYEYGNRQMKEHEKIIKDLAKKKLAPLGFFQKGASRLWIRDNLYFLSIIEFTPHSWQQGTYVRACISFLWEKNEDPDDSIGFDIAENISGRVGQFIEFVSEDPDVFATVLEQYIDLAFNKLKEFENFSDPGCAKEYFEKLTDFGKSDIRKVYDLAMICFLNGDHADGERYFRNLIEQSEASIYRNGRYIAWVDGFAKYCRFELLPKFEEPENARKTVQQMINRRRAYLGSKKSFAGLRHDPVYTV